MNASLQDLNASFFATGAPMIPNPISIQDTSQNKFDLAHLVVASNSVVRAFGMSWVRFSSGDKIFIFFTNFWSSIDILQSY